MDTVTNSPQLADLQNMLGVADLAGLALMVVAAIVTGFVLATTPKKLKLLAYLYLAAMAGAFYLHIDKYIPALIASGVVASIVFYPFRPKAKTA